MGSRKLTGVSLEGRLSRTEVCLQYCQISRPQSASQPWVAQQVSCRGRKERRLGLRFPVLLMELGALTASI